MGLLTRQHTLYLLATLLGCPSAWATRPMVVDDAAITSPGNCQVESWTQRMPGRTEYWAVPACNVTGTWELAVGGGRVELDGPRSAFHGGVVQAKTVFHTMQKNGWGIGLTIADQFQEGAGLSGDLSVLLPVSLSFLNDQILVHANVGWLHSHAGGRSDGFWALGTEWAVRPQVTLTLETYGATHSPGFAQAGARFTLIPDRLAFDAGVGSHIRSKGTERYATFGLTFAGPVLR
jgi:hypothetical protein